MQKQHLLCTELGKVEKGVFGRFPKALLRRVQLRNNKLWLQARARARLNLSLSHSESPDY